MRNALLLWVLMCSVHAVMAKPIAIENVTLIDGTGAPAMVRATVIVEGERITAVGSQSKVPRSAQRIDGTGKYLIPGMMDLHVHLVGAGAWIGPSNKPGQPFDLDASIEALHGYLYYGFTTVFDCGNNPDFILLLRDSERAGRIIAPRIFATGQILSYPGSSHVGFAGIGVRDWPETIKDLELQLSRRPDIQKFTYEEAGVGANPLTPSLPKELMGRMNAYMHGHGVKTMVHISSERMARDAIEVGVDKLMHVPNVGLITQSFATLLAKKKIPVQTTLSAGDEIAQVGRGVDFRKIPEYAATVSPEIITTRSNTLAKYAKPESLAWYEVISPYVRRNLKMIHEAGGILALGSDSSFAPSALRELELVNAAGITPSDVIKIATRQAAIFIDRQKDLGSIEPGKLADLVLLDADPLVDIRNIRRVTMVMKAGTIIDRNKLRIPANRKP